MNEILERPPDAEAVMASPGGLDVFVEECGVDVPFEGSVLEVLSEESGLEILSSLPVGSRLVLRSRKDWRTATVAAISDERITLTVASPTGHTYRMYRPHDTPIFYDGSIPLLAEGSWRVGLARYDVRW